MSKFAKALEQAQRERALRTHADTPASPPAPEPRVIPPPPVTPPPMPAPPPVTAPSPTGWPPPATPRKLASRGPRHGEVTGDVDGHLVSLVAPAGLQAERYRALRHLVEGKHKVDNLCVIAISSPGVGDGKTTTAINLAGTLAQAPEARVLLVEADLRRPSIGHLLGFADADTPGLVHAILDPHLTLADIVQPRPPFNLSVVLAGQTPPSPYEVLKSPRLGALLDEARGNYDYVIVDTAPLAAVQDCRVIARWVDGIILVVAAHNTPRPLLDAAFDVLDPSKLVGLVFNGFDPLAAAGHSRQYSAYYMPPTADAVQRPGRFSWATTKLAALLGQRPAAERRPRRAKDRSR